MGTGERMALKKKEAAGQKHVVSGFKSLEVVGSADPKLWLSATPELVTTARTASEYLFSVLGAHTESELGKLLTENFDSEQIWQQIDLQATPTLDKINKSLRKLEGTPQLKFFRLGDKKADAGGFSEEKKRAFEDDQSEDLDGGEMSGSDGEDEDGNDFDDEDEAEEVSEPEEEYSDYDEEEKKVVEDKFLKLSEMEKFLDRADAEDAGIAEEDDDDGDEEGDDDDGEALSEFDEEEDDEDLEVGEAFDFSAKLASKEIVDSTWGPKYSDFIGKVKKQKSEPSDKRSSDDELEEDDFGEGDEGEEEDDDDDEEAATMDIEPLETKKLSSHERQQGKTKRRIEQLEKANSESKDWTMQGEVSASRRSKNSALEVELEFEHGARPAPVITEEVTQSLEDIIRRRIIEENFDDPQPRLAPATAAPKERIEMDEEKSKKGLGEIYAQEYMESTGLAVAATPAMEALQAEATILFKNLCHKLDALSHFHFASKPAVEEMEVKIDVPALAMEEVAPTAVSDASMLAPEEVYKNAGGLIKGESELLPEERQRRRAQKKRKRKGAKDAAENLKKLRMQNGPVIKDSLKELNVKATPLKDKRTTSSFSKSSKVFAELDKARESGNKAVKFDKADKPALNASILKL
ncbi:hypothetical protein KC19_8G187700 [Ceratodon purpureus]|uniref:U3 small nucleolar ribonucleoprotein protein MPP10 n=1 Tax=Ceratodon purpureus TaxID=3225 RepID=A0A8T0H0H9_CERPU|nr:hypothetical protein KC19_8G187700 [Ceratodon purpureus]